MKLRDLGYYLAFLVALTVAEFVGFAVFGFEPKPFAHLQVTAAFGVVLMAIRERGND